MRIISSSVENTSFRFERCTLPFSFYQRGSSRRSMLGSLPPSSDTAAFCVGASAVGMRSCSAHGIAGSFSSVSNCVFLFFFKKKHYIETEASVAALQQSQHYQCYSWCNICRADVWEEGLSLSWRNTHTHTPQNIQRIERVSACSYHYDTCSCLPSQPSPYCCSKTLVGRKRQKRCNSGQQN